MSQRVAGARGAILAGLAVLVLSVGPAAIMGYALAGVVHQLRDEQAQLDSVVATLAALVGKNSQRSLGNELRLDQAGGELGDLARQAETTQAKLAELIAAIQSTSGQRRAALAKIAQLEAQLAALQRRMAALEARQQGRPGPQGVPGPAGPPGGLLPRTPPPTPAPQPCVPILGPCAAL